MPDLHSTSWRIDKLVAKVQLLISCKYHIGVTYDFCDFSNSNIYFICIKKTINFLILYLIHQFYINKKSKKKK